MITVTTKAVKQVRNLIAEQNDSTEYHLRLAVSGGGCSGLEYFLGLDTNVSPEDEIFEYDGLKVLVDKVSLPYLEGSTLDFSNDLMNSGFIFNNPNARRTCGCGKSFCG